jgi:hypothetical protein
MFKYVLSLTFAVSLASAATITTTATCDGVTTVGTTSAMCNIPFIASASASIAAPSFEQSPSFLATSFQVSVSAAGTGPVFSTSASADFSDDYVFTVFGGTGGGLFFPCFSGAGQGSAGGNFAGVSFGFTDVPGNGTSNCLFNQLRGGTPQPFTFGVPQIVAVGLQGLAVVGSKRRI